MLRLQSHGLKHFSLWFSFPLRSNRSPPELTKRLQMGFVHDDQMDIYLKRQLQHLTYKLEIFPVSNYPATYYPQKRPIKSNEYFKRFCLSTLSTHHVWNFSFLNQFFISGRFAFLLFNIFICRNPPGCLFIRNVPSSD